MVFGGSAWPKQRLVVDGDTAVFLFSAGSKDDGSGRPSARWGFKCVVTEFRDMTSYQCYIDHWSLDVQASLSVLCAKHVSALISGDSVTLR